VTRVSRHDRCVVGDGVSRDGEIEVVHAFAATFQVRFEVTEAPAHLVVPLCPRHGREQGDEAACQLSLSTRGRQTCEAVPNLCDGGLRQEHVRRALLEHARRRSRLSAHERRGDSRVEDVSQSLGGLLRDERRRRTAARLSSSSLLAAEEMGSASM